MELFDKKFVHFMWDDALKGKKVFVADYIDSLQAIVEKGNENNLCQITFSEEEWKPFKVRNMDITWQFAYYDPNYWVKKAFKEGKEIQFQSADGEWNSIVGEDMLKWYIEEGCKLRVKPECPCTDGIDSKACAGCQQDEERKQTVRPFKDCDELVEFWSLNYQSVMRHTFTKPLIWVRLKDDKRERLIVAYGDNFVEIGNKTKAVTLQHLFEQYEFLDGSPVGMEVKE